MKKPPFITEEGQLRWHSTDAFNWKRSIGRLHVHANMRRTDGAMGRMGGGWLWKFGVLAARTEIVLELFVMTVRLRWNAKAARITDQPNQR